MGLWLPEHHPWHQKSPPQTPRAEPCPCCLLPSDLSTATSKETLLFKTFVLELELSPSCCLEPGPWPPWETVSEMVPSWCWVVRGLGPASLSECYVPVGIHFPPPRGPRPLTQYQLISISVQLHPHLVVLEVIRCCCVQPDPSSITPCPRLLLCSPTPPPPHHHLSSGIKCPATNIQLQA